MYKVLLLLLLVSALMPPVGVMAQSVEPAKNIFAGGVSYSNGATPAFAGTGLYARYVAGNGTYAFTAVDVLPSTYKPFTVTTQFSVGLAQRLITIGTVQVFVPTSAGVSYTGVNTGWGWNTGALVSVPVKGRWLIMPTVRVLKSSVSGGTGYQLTTGVLFGWGQ